MTSQQKRAISRAYNTQVQPRSAPSSPRLINTLTVEREDTWRTCYVVDRHGMTRRRIGYWLRRYAPQVYGTPSASAVSPSGQTFYTRGHLTITPDKFYVFVHGWHEV